MIEQSEINELFLDASNTKNADDECADFLYEASQGNLPEGYVVEEEDSQIVLKTQEKAMVLPRGNPKAVYTLVLSELFQSLDKNPKPEHWKHVKPKSMKNQLIMNFVKEQIDIHGGNTRKVYNLVQLGFHFKNFTSDDVKFEDMRIVEIKGFGFDEDTNTFTITSKTKAIPKMEKVQIKPNKLKQEMDSWIREYKNRGVRGVFV